MTAKTISVLAIVGALAMTAASDRIMARNVPPQAGTTLITLGTAGGPVPRAAAVFAYGSLLTLRNPSVTYYVTKWLR